MAGRIEALQFNGFADLDDIAGANAAVHVWNAAPGICVRDNLCAGSRYHRLVATRVIAVLMRVEDLRDVPASLLCGRKALCIVQRINRQRLARLRAGNQVIKISIRIPRPDLLNDHDLSP